MQDKLSRIEKISLSLSNIVDELVAHADPNQKDQGLDSRDIDEKIKIFNVGNGWLDKVLSNKSHLIPLMRSLPKEDKIFLTKLNAGGSNARNITGRT